jgi:hypothetical protein
MKNLKVVTALTVCLILGSCEKDKNCNCGTITNDDIEISNSQFYYTLTIENDCSGNKQKFYFDYNTWLNAPVGQHFCVTNVSSWLPQSEPEVKAVENKEVI